MTDQEINTEIARWCGKKLRIPIRETRFGPSHLNGKKIIDKIVGHKPARISNYCHDLNAMNDVEKRMLEKTPDLRWEYAHYLYNVVVPKNEQPFMASAKSRAEAFLRTIRKWK